MHLEATGDLGAVAAVMRHPAVWPWVSNEETPADWAPEAGAGRQWYLVRAADAADAEVTGVLRLDTPGVAAREGWAQLHVAFLPEGRGPDALAAWRGLWPLARENGLAVVYGLVPADNRPCARMAALAGMERITPGVLRQALLRGGVRHDLWVFGKRLN